MTYDRQIETVRSLMTPPNSSYELRGYEVDRVGSTSTLQVVRTYSQPGMKIEYHECIFVGPRGGCKTIYNSFY
jgi:hypothetical protein